MKPKIVELSLPVEITHIEETDVYRIEFLPAAPVMIPTGALCLVSLRESKPTAPPPLAKMS